LLPCAKKLFGQADRLRRACPRPIREFSLS
jgi:hypothetical protein